MRDWYGVYQSEVFVEPLGPSSGDYRVVRGGSFTVSPVNLRSADRGGVDPVSRGGLVGFRCVRVPPQP